MNKYTRWLLMALAMPFAAAAFWLMILMGPIGWVILLVLAISDIAKMREDRKDRRHREMLEAMKRAS